MTKNIIILQKNYLLFQKYGKINMTNKRGGIKMKFTNNKKIAVATVATTMMSTVVNAMVPMASETSSISRDLGDWVAIVAEILSVLCLIIFAIYMGRFFSIKTDKDSENDTKVAPGVKNGMMTALIGIAICQAAIIVSQLCF